jgi:hypothetical protein
MRPYESIRDGAAAMEGRRSTQYGALELGGNARAEEVEEGGLLAARAGGSSRTNGGAVMAIILALLGVLLTALTIASAYTSPSAAAVAGRLQASGPTAGTAREGGGWQDMIPAQWRPKVNSTATNGGGATTTSSGSGGGGGGGGGAAGPSGYNDARNCTLAECESFKCNTTMPFVCVDGFAAGGCAMVASAWSNPGCDDFCTQDFCPHHKDDAAADDDDSTTPKQLLRATGPAAAANASTPATNSSSTTSSAGNKGNTTAPAPTSPPSSSSHTPRSCTLTECTQYQCVASLPFVCVEGLAKGGCAMTAAAWNNTGCKSFCSREHCQAQVPKCGPCSDADCERLEVTCGACGRVAVCGILFVSVLVFLWVLDGWMDGWIDGLLWWWW